MFEDWNVSFILPRIVTELFGPYSSETSSDLSPGMENTSLTSSFVENKFNFGYPTLDFVVFRFALLRKNSSKNLLNVDSIGEKRSSLLIRFIYYLFL